MHDPLQPVGGGRTGVEPDPVHWVMRLAPLTTGLAPTPYEEIVIGLPDEPEEGGTSCSCHISPLFRRIESPGPNEEELTFANVFHGAPLLVPGLESLPEFATKYVVANEGKQQTKRQTMLFIDTPWQYVVST